MRDKIKNFFKRKIINIYRYEFDIKTPAFDKWLMFSDQEQAKQFYLFMCWKYINLIKETKKEEAQELAKIIQDFVLLSEWLWFYGLTQYYSIK